MYDNNYNLKIDDNANDVIVDELNVEKAADVKNNYEKFTVINPDIIARDGIILGNININPNVDMKAEENNMDNDEEE